MARQQLPPQIKKIELASTTRGRADIRYQVTVDTGPNPATGKRGQTRRRFRTEEKARKYLAEVQNDAARGTYVHATALTVDQACKDWLAGRRVRPTTLSAYTHSLQPLRDVHGALPVQKLTKRHLDDLVSDLLEGRLAVAGRKSGVKKWTANTINPMLNHTEAMLAGLEKQGVIARNVAALVDRVPREQKETQTFTEDEVRTLLAHVKRERLGHAWHLALSGLRRGEIAGLRWADVDLDAGTLTIRHNRVSVNGRATEGAPKSRRSARTLPLTKSLTLALKRARKQQAAEQLLAGGQYEPGDYVVCDERGRPCHPDSLSKWWPGVCKAAGVSVVRLHDARHTCGTLMHLQGVPIAVISAWLGHADAAFTMRTYMHSQDDALKAAAASLQRLVTTRDKTAGG